MAEGDVTVTVEQVAGRIMSKTSELRFVVRTVDGRQVRILQQKHLMMSENDKGWLGYGGEEWIDVPLVEEPAT